MAPEWLHVVVPRGQPFDPGDLAALTEKVERVLDEVEDGLAVLPEGDGPRTREVLRLANLVAPGDPLVGLDDVPRLVSWIHRRPVSWLECEADEVAELSLQNAAPEDFRHDFEGCIINGRPDLRHLLPQSRREPFDSSPPNPRFDGEPVAQWVNIGSDQDGHGFLFFDPSKARPRFIKVHNDDPDFGVVEYDGCEALLVRRVLPDIVACVRFDLENE